MNTELIAGVAVVVVVTGAMLIFFAPEIRKMLGRHKEKQQLKQEDKDRKDTLLSKVMEEQRIAGLASFICARHTTWAECWEAMQAVLHKYDAAELNKLWRAVCNRKGNRAGMQEATYQWVVQASGTIGDRRMGVVMQVDPHLYSIIRRKVEDARTLKENTTPAKCQPEQQPLQDPHAAAFRVWCEELPARALLRTIDFAKPGNAKLRALRAYAARVTPEWLAYHMETASKLSERDIAEFQAIHAELTLLGQDPIMKIARHIKSLTSDHEKERLVQHVVHYRSVWESTSLSRARDLLSYLDIPEAFPEIHEEFFPRTEVKPEPEAEAQQPS